MMSNCSPSRSHSATACCNSLRHSQRHHRSCSRAPHVRRPKPRGRRGSRNRLAPARRQGPFHDPARPTGAVLRPSW
jgi:hypothetical protein